jgi:RNA polymerase sigma-70 factor (ECF subfamily)
MKTSFPSESDLIERARLRDEPAFAELVEAYTPVLYRVVRRMSTDTLEAESLVQETFWRFWNVLPMYKADRPLLPYLATIASNLARDRYRREHRMVDADANTVLERSSHQDTDLEERVDQKEDLQVLAEAVDSLPFAYRAVISLRYDADMSYEDIAAILSLPLNTVRTHLRRAKQILRGKIEEADHG